MNKDIRIKKFCSIIMQEWKYFPYISLFVTLCILLFHEEHEGNTKLHWEKNILLRVPLWNLCERIVHEGEKNKRQIIIKEWKYFPYISLFVTLCIILFHEEHEGNTKIHREEHIYFVFLCETSVYLCERILHEEEN